MRLRGASLKLARQASRRLWPIAGAALMAAAVTWSVPSCIPVLEAGDFAKVDRIRSAVAALQDRAGIVREWRKVFDKGRTQVIIGGESKVTSSGRLGMVATLFYREGRRAGALGVVGPRRMDYVHIVPVVEYIGDTLTRVLEQPGAIHA